MTLGSYLWNCLCPHEHKSAFPPLMSLHKHPSGENRNLLPTHRVKGVVRNTHLTLALLLGPNSGSQFHSGLGALHKTHVISALWPERKEHRPRYRKRLGRKGCSPHRLPQPLADHQDGPGAPLLTQARVTTAYTPELRQSMTEEGSAVHPTQQKNSPTILLFFF